MSKPKPFALRKLMVYGKAFEAEEFAPSFQNTGRTFNEKYRDHEDLLIRITKNYFQEISHLKSLYNFHATCIVLQKSNAIGKPQGFGRIVIRTR